MWKKKILSFNNCRRVSGSFWGHAYTVYLDQNEYKEKQKDKLRREELMDYIGRNYKETSLENLEKIKDILNHKL